MKNGNNSTKSVVTVSEMAALCNLSRSRWYEMVEAGIFPQPVRLPSSKRPIYDQQLIAKCLEIRATGVGLTGPVLFNRKSETHSKKNVKKRERKSPADPQIEEIVDAVKALGLTTSNNLVHEALVNLYPDGIDGIAQGDVIRQVFLHLQTK